MELEELIASIDLLEYVSQYTDFTERNGEYWALSPLKEERTPSFSIRKEANSFYDFSSGIGGNVLTFVRYHDKCGYAEAIKKLKDYAGISGEIKHRQRLSATEVARKFSKSKKARSHEVSSRVLPPDYMTMYERRQDKLVVWEEEGISRDSLERFQVRYDSFSNRLVYPIRDAAGNIVNVGGRTLDKDWKQKNLRKYTYFFGWNGGMHVIYGLFENREAILAQKQIILFEGAKSVMLADTYGIKNAGAILTSHLSDAQLKILIGLGADVVFALDKDVRVTDDHNIRRLQRFVNVHYLYDRENVLGDKDSPIDKGKEVFRTLYAQRIRYR